MGSHVKQAGALGTSVGQSTERVGGSVLAKATYLSAIFIINMDMRPLTI